MEMAELHAWLDGAKPAHFPNSPVIDEFLRAGSHFVPEETLKNLALTRDTLTRDTADRLAVRMLGTRSGTGSTGARPT